MSPRTMQLVQEIRLIDAGGFTATPAWNRIIRDLAEAVAS